MTKPYTTINDAAENPAVREEPGAAWSSLVEVEPGTGSRVWYCRPERCRHGHRLGDCAAPECEIFDRDITAIRQLRLAGVGFEPARVEKTHVLLGEIAERDTDVIFAVLQGEVWSPNGEARQLIEAKGLAHTSMSVGDVVEVDGIYCVCQPNGWQRSVSRLGGGLTITEVSDDDLAAAGVELPAGKTCGCADDEPCDQTQFDCEPSREQALATILAALRAYQEAGYGEPANRPEALHEIATSGDQVISLDDAGIDQLCGALSFGDLVLVPHATIHSIVRAVGALIDASERDFS